MISSKEYFAYLGVYIGFIFWSIYTIYLQGIEISNTTGYGLKEGWSTLGRVQDVSDEEWEYFKSFIKNNLFWYSIHILSSEIVRAVNRKRVPIAHAVTGLAFILASFQTVTTLTIVSSIFSFYVISRYDSRSLVWLIVVTWVAVISALKLYPQIFGFDEFYGAVFTLSWGFLRCSNYNFSKIENAVKNKNESLYSFINYCGYTLYFPALTFGPLILFERYIICIDEAAQAPASKGRISRFLKDIARILMWAILKEFVLHFLYISYLKISIWTVQEFSFWTLYALGYFMGQLFHMYYVITYGLSISIARFEGMNPPQSPKCLGRMAFSFRMWKNFDQGMYEYMAKYIYFPVCGNNFSIYRKTLATVITFVFVFAWHGMYAFVLLWTIFNFLCLCAERTFLYFIATRRYKQFMDKYFSKSNQLRFYGLVGSQIFIPSAISNFYFFGGVEIGHLYIKNTYMGSFWNYLGLTFCSYCIFQCADLTWKAKKEK